MFMTTKKKVNNNVSKHYKNKRYKREKIIKKYINGDGKVIDAFIVDKGHKNGVERHEITEHGIILIYNAKTNILVSKLIARPNQIKRYYKKEGRKVPSNILFIAQWHESLGYNK